MEELRRKHVAPSFSIPLASAALAGAGKESPGEVQRYPNLKGFLLYSTIDGCARYHAVVVVCVAWSCIIVPWFYMATSVYVSCSTTMYYCKGVHLATG